MRSKDGRFEYLDLGYDSLPEGSAPERVARFGFQCPNGRGWCSGLLIRNGHHNVHPSWSWDRNIDAPTFSPSINCLRCGWHGWIKEGVIK
jgi:hypothetical protein